MKNQVQAERDKVLGANIRNRRLLLGFDQQEAAERIGVSRVAYNQIEAGKTAPRESTFEKLVEVLKISPFALVRPMRTAKAMRFRTRAVATQRAQAAVDSTVDEAMRRLTDYTFLEGVQADGPKGKARTRTLPTRNAGESAVMLADRTRRAFFGEGPIPVAEFVPSLEEHGVKVLSFAFLAEDTFGFSFGVADGGPAIVLNASPDIPAERKLFTLAHELGHLLMHKDDYGCAGGVEDKSREDEADAFASEFIIPAKLFDKAWAEANGLDWLSRVLHVKAVFHVSYLTVLHRLKAQGREPPTCYDRFRDEWARHTGVVLTRKQEPSPMVFSCEPLRYRLLARLAFEKEEISISRLGELLGKDIFQVRALVNDWSREK